MNPKEVDIFIPCFIDQVYPHTGFNMVKVLEKAGVKAHYNTNQTCCGQLAFNSGFWDEAKKLGEKFIKDFNNEHMIVGPSASCIGYVRKGYDELFYNGALHNEYKQLQRNIYEITDFLVNIVKVTNFGSVFEHKVTYHDSCAALRDYKLKDEPRQLLSNVKGLELIEMKNTDECCGFGGTFSIKFEPISTAMAEQKVRNALDTGAEYIVSTDSSCLMHQFAYIKKHNLPIKVAHIVDVLASGI
ncbi:MAG: (Fe-S)-binding protein [Bacteroidetes bacterium]|nr:(Fe-S)-binding protein [Bacteroidota bacterium]MBL6943795.1 (Fe-S)-binding protein [Bacteroidales bacterium]